MRRREFIILISSATAAWSGRGQAQQSEMRTIGFRSLGWERDNQEIVEAFWSGLNALGYTEGRNIRVLYRFANGNADRLSALTLELVSLGAIVIVMFQSPHGWALIQ